MSDNTYLGDRMKRHEAAFRTVLPPRTYTVVRLDGRAFHTYLRGAARPYDQTFMDDMDAVTQTLCQDVAGAQFAYTQSDEISILVTDFATPSTQPWFGGVTAKITSITASLATAVLNERRPGRRALFDSRVFAISDPREVAAYFIWRQRDAIRNSIAMTAQTYFSHRQLHGLSADEMQKLLLTEAGVDRQLHGLSADELPKLLLTEAGVDWEGQPAGFRRGRVAVRCTGERETTYTDRRTGIEHTGTALRSWWESAPAEPFTNMRIGWLRTHIPLRPLLVDAAPSERPEDAR